MKLAHTIAAVAAAAVVTTGTAFAAESTVEDTATGRITTYEAPATAERPLFANPLNPATWWDGTEGMDLAEKAKPEMFNMAHPSFWLSIIDPDTHSKRHMQFTNPQTYAQFMNPAFYMQFANPENWMAWMTPANYEILIEPETYTYWMQPGAYLHASQPHGYMQMLDLENYSAFFSPATYLQMMNPAAYDVSETTDGWENVIDGVNPVDMIGYMTSMLNAN